MLSEPVQMLFQQPVGEEELLNQLDQKLGMQLLTLSQLLRLLGMKVLLSQMLLLLFLLLSVLQSLLTLQECPRLLLQMKVQQREHQSPKLQLIQARCA